MQLLQGGVQADRAPCGRAKQCASVHVADARVQSDVHACMCQMHACRATCTLACGRCTRAERRACLQSLESIFQLSFQLIKLLFKPALAGTHHPIVNKENDANERECTEKKRVTTSRSAPANLSRHFPFKDCCSGTCEPERACSTLKLAGSANYAVDFGEF